MKRKIIAGISFFSVLLGVCLPISLYATTWYVNGGGLKATIESASSGDTILVAGGTYFEEDILIQKSMSLLGGYNPADWTRNIPVFRTVIQPDSICYVVFECHNASNLIIDGFVIEGLNYSDYTIWAHNVTNLYLRNNIIRNGAYEGLYFTHRDIYVNLHLFSNVIESISFATLPWAGPSPPDLNVNGANNTIGYMYNYIGGARLNQFRNNIISRLSH